MKVKKLSLEDAAVNIFDISLMFFLAAWVVFSQQASNALATTVVHFSTGLFLAASVLLLIVNRLKTCPPIHMIWYVGFILMSMLFSVMLNDTNDVYSVFPIMLRILWVSFFVAVRLTRCTSVGGYVEKLSWTGIIEIFLLILSIPRQEWVNVFISGTRLGAGNIEVNMCALSLAYSVVFCFLGIREGHKKYIVAGLADLAVLLLFQSRMAYLVIITGIIIFWVSYYGFFANAVKRFVRYGMIGTCFGAYVLVFTDFGNKFLGRIFSSDRGIIYRILIFKTSVQIWWEQPFIGHGIGTVNGLMYEVLGRGWSAHNNMMGLLMCVGIIGFLYYYIFIFYWGMVAAAGKKKNKDLSIAFTLLILTVLTDLTGENYCTVLSQTVLAIAVGAINILNTQKGEDNEQNPYRSKSGRRIVWEIYRRQRGTSQRMGGSEKNIG